jgi:RNA polymerase sigma-70 factor (ECF subfamily)
VRALVRRRFADPDRCEDVVQDVLLAIHRVRQTYDPRRPITPWIAAIASRRCVDAIRRRTRVAAVETPEAGRYETFPDPGANKQVEAGEAAEAATALLATLPPGQRQALELVKLKELSLAEASAISGQSVGALKVNVHRAIKALRLRLTGGAP